MRERVALTRSNRVKNYSMDSWALFRAVMQRAPSEEVWGHQYDELAATHERSPPLA